MIDVFIYPSSKQKTASLFATVRLERTRYKYPVGISVETRYWSFEKQRAKENNSYQASAIIINSRIDSVKNAIVLVSGNFIARAVKPSQQEFSLAVKKAITPLAPPDQYFVPFAENFYPTLTRAKDTSKKYVTTVNKLKDFEKENNVRLTFENINAAFYNDLSRFFSAKGYSLNYFGGIARVIKYFYKEAREQGLHNFSLPTSFVARNVTADSIYLTVVELYKIHNMVINEDLILDKLDTKIINIEGGIERMITSLQDCRDRFLVGAFTALRFRDYSILSGLKHSDAFITKTSHKTAVKTIIPMHPVIKEILIRRNNILPKSISNQRMNKQLKVIGKLADINEQLEITTQLVTGLKTESLPKYELITTHTARRSGCTNMYLAGIDIVSIMSFSGHKSTSSFLKYIKASQTEVATRLQNHPFFNPSTH